MGEAAARGFDLGAGAAVRGLLVAAAFATVLVVVGVLVPSTAATVLGGLVGLVAVGFAALLLRALLRRFRGIEQKLDRVDRAVVQGTDKLAQTRAGSLERAEGQREAVLALLSAHRDLAEQLSQVTALLVAPAEGAGQVTDGVPALDDGPAGTPPAFLSTRLALAMLTLLVDAGDVMAADHLARSHDLAADAPLRQQRALARQLRDRGYLTRAMVWFEAAALVGDPRDVHALELRRAETAVLSGTSRPAPLPCTELGTAGNRVLHVVGKTLPGTQSGYTLRTHYTALAQARAGLEPHVVGQAGSTEHTEPAREDIDGIAYHRVPGPDPLQVGAVQWLEQNTRGLLQVVQQVRPALLHAHSDYLNSLSAQAVGEATGIPVVYEARGFWEESWLSRAIDRYEWADLDAQVRAHGMPEAYSWRRDREREARGRASHVVTLARVMAERIVGDGLDPQRLTLAPNAVDTAAFPVTGRDERLAAELGIGSDELVVGYVSSVVEYEGIDTLVDAFALLRGSTKARLRLLVVGGGPVLAQLRRRAADRGLDDAIFTGGVPHHDIPGYYSLLDVFVVPRRPTGVCHIVTPLKPFEAFSTGRTVVLSDVRALAEIAADSDAAALFRAGDPASLAETLGRLVADPERRAVLAERGASWVREHRTWDANAREYLRTYRRLGLSA